jgi:threonine dehydratase
VKAVNPKIKVIGVEAEDAEAMTKSLKVKKRIMLNRVGLFAEGAAVKQVGAHNFELAQAYVDEMIVVDNDEICAAIKDVFEDTRTILEPAGALATAGIKSYVKKNNLTSENLIGIASGANMNFDRLRFVAERAEIGEQREAILSVTIPEKPGAFKAFCNLIGSRNITEFNYRFSNPKKAQIFVGLTINEVGETKKLIKNFKDHDLEAIDLTNDEMAKLHLRHLVGGHAPQAKDEVVYRFEFPEKPGALLNFLNHMGQNWNISLFHYRNHGADIGRVLVGMQVPKKDNETFKAFLNQLEYPYFDESSNPGYKMFLGSNE